MCWCRRGIRRFDALPANAVVGTSSLRRQAQLRAWRPDLEYIEFRGNVDTRLAKLAQGKADAIILAAAGLERLQKTAAIRERFAPEVLCPAPGQGALAIECRAGDQPMLAALQPLEDLDTRMAITAERRCLAALGGGCLVPIGATATAAETNYRCAPWWPPDGREMVCAKRRHADPEVLGEQLAQQLLEQGAGAILELLRSGGSEHAPAPCRAAHPDYPCASPGGTLAEALEALGAEVLRLPTIEIFLPESYAHLDALLEVISGFDWLIDQRQWGGRLWQTDAVSGNSCRTVAAFAGGRDWPCDRRIRGPHRSESVYHA